MATSRGPSTPERPPRNLHSSLNRSFTVPARFSPATPSNAPLNAPSAEIGAAEGIETLYVHPSAKVIKFAASAARHGSNLRRDENEAGTLPWASPSERTLANGPLEIYRVPGSVSFIHSGSLLHAIMPRSQCWCVDGKSKFAIRVALPDTYYRIELPGESSADMEKVAEFEVTLRKVLFYERTLCPFARSFTVDLPAAPEVRKKRRKSHGPAKKWRLARANSWKPEDGEEPPPEADGEDEYGSASDSEEGLAGNDSSLDEAQSDASGLAEEMRDVSMASPSRPSVRDRIADLTALWTADSPPQLSTTSPSMSRPRATATIDGVHDPEAVDPVIRNQPPESQNFQPVLVAMPPSPANSSTGVRAYPSNSVNVEQAIRSTEQLFTIGLGQSSQSPPSELVDGIIRDEQILLPADMVIPSSLPGHDLGDTTHSSSKAPDINSIGTLSSRSAMRMDPAEAIPIGSEDQSQDPDDGTPSEDPYAQIKAKIQARRSIGSPGGKPSLRHVSSSSSVASLSSQKPFSRVSHAQQQQQQQAFASALMRKAVSKFLGPPASLVSIMLKIAAHYANGALSIDLGFERTPEFAPRRVPGSFDLDGIDFEEFDALGESQSQHKIEVDTA